MIHFIRPYYDFDSNVYLLTGDRNILIDTGTGLSSDHLINSVRSIIGKDGVLDQILLTHCHFDHVGGCPALVKAFGCKVCAGFVDAESIRTGDDQAILSKQVGIEVPPIPLGDLRHGDIIDIGAHRLQVLETPGHTRGGVCYLDEVTSSLFSGDTLFSNSVGRTDLYGGSLSSLRNSIKYLRDIAFKDLYPGHGDPTSDGPLAIKIGLQIVGD